MRMVAGDRVKLHDQVRVIDHNHEAYDFVGDVTALYDGIVHVYIDDLSTSYVYRGGQLEVIDGK